MAENESTAAVADESEQTLPFSIQIEDAGPAAKRVTVEIPADYVADRLKTQYKELRSELQLPGFRKGHAPQKLIEKKFAGDVKNEVRAALLRESYEAAIEKHSLSVIGEPEFDNPNAIQIADNAPLAYSFQVEVQPQFDLPELKGIAVKKPKIEVTEKHLEQAMTNLRNQQGSWVPVEDRGVAAGDRITADLHLKLSNGTVFAHQHDVDFEVKPARINGIQIDDLARQMEGARPGEVRIIPAKSPLTHPHEPLRGVEVVFEIKVKEIKRLEPIEITPEFLDSLGFANEQELRDALMEQMRERVDADIKRNMRRQVTDYLLANTNVALPEKLSARQAQRVVQRRQVDLILRGVPREQVEANIDAIRTGAAQTAAEELKTFFVLQKVANDLNVDVTEAELNGRVATLAIQQGMRPEKLLEQMQRDQTLANLYLAMREERAIDQILQDANIEEVEQAASDEQVTGESANEQVIGQTPTITEAAPAPDPAARDDSSQRT